MRTLRLKIVPRLQDLRTASNLIFSSLKLIFFYVFFIELAVLLAVKGLNDNCFWDDEAETAMIAKNLLATGRLTGWDGRHLCTYRNGSLLDDNFRPKNPIGMYLMTAASFRLFGETTIAGRLPFVFLGLGALCLLFGMLRADYPSHPTFARYSAALMAFSTSYLLYIRQCRYYALCIFFSLLALAFYRAIARNPRWASFIGLGASLAALFFSHYLIMICFTGALLANHLVFHASRWGKKEYFRAILTCGLFLLPVVWFAMLNRIWIRPDMAGDTGTPAQILTRLYLNLRDFDAFGVLPGLVAFGGAACAIRLRKNYAEASPFLEFGFFIVAYIVILSILSPQSVHDAQFDTLADIRYMVALIPLGAICAGALLSVIHGKTKFLALFLFCAITCTNTLCLRWINPQLRLLLPAYIYEIMHDYKTPYEAVIDFLCSHPTFMNDTITCTPDYCQLPIQFYCGDFIRMGGQLDEKTSLPVSKTRALPAPLFQDAYFPTWIISFGLSNVQAEKISYFSRGKYKYASDPQLSLPVFFNDMTRPELPWHNFTKIDNVDAANAVHLFRRVIPSEK